MSEEQRLRRTIGRSAVALTALILLIGGFAWLGGGRAVAQPRTDHVIQEYIAPPGEYTALVFATWSDTKWEGFHVKMLAPKGAKGEQPFEIVAKSGETTVIPFERGWTIDRPMRFEISPYAPTNAVRIWGITAEGPVAFEPTS